MLPNHRGKKQNLLLQVRAGPGVYEDGEVYERVRKLGERVREGCKT